MINLIKLSINRNFAKFKQKYAKIKNDLRFKIRKQPQERKLKSALRIHPHFGYHM